MNFIYRYPYTDTGIKTAIRTVSLPDELILGDGEKMAITLEFWRSDALGVVYVVYNGKNYKLKEFLALPEAGEIVANIYDKIQSDYPYQDSGSMIDTVGDFIKKHFLELDKTFDVVILGNKSKQSVIFNLEDKRYY